MLGQDTSSRGTSERVEIRALTEVLSLDRYSRFDRLKYPRPPKHPRNDKIF